MCNFWQTSWNFAPPLPPRWELTGAATWMQPDQEAAPGLESSMWRKLRSKKIFNNVLHLPQSSERLAISNDDLLSPKVLHEARKNEKSPHTITDAQLAKSIQVPNVNKSKPLVWLLAFNSVCKFCPGEAGGEAVRKSPQLFTFFLPAPPQEAAPAANGAQQRLDSLVRIRDPRARRDLWLTSAQSVQTLPSFSAALRPSSELHQQPSGGLKVDLAVFKGLQRGATETWGMRYTLYGDIYQYTVHV